MIRRGRWHRPAPVALRSEPGWSAAVWRRGADARSAGPPRLRPKRWRRPAARAARRL